MSDEYVPKGDYDDILRPSLVASAAAAPAVLVPVADTASVATIQGLMMGNIAKRAGHEIDAQYFTKVLAGITIGSSMHTVGRFAVKKIIQKFMAYSFIFTAPTITLAGVTNVVTTWRLGRAFIELVEREDFTLTDVGYLVEVLGKAIAPRPTPREARLIIDFLRGV